MIETRLPLLRASRKPTPGATGYWIIWPRFTIRIQRKLEVDLSCLIPGLPALFGALFGAGSAIIAGWLSDRRKQQHEDRHRDHDQRREAYLRFLSACDRVHEGERGKDIFIELKRSAQNTKLVSPSKRVIEAAEKLFLLLAWDTVNDSNLPMKDMNRYDKNLEEFYAAAREDLGKPELRELS